MNFKIQVRVQQEASVNWPKIQAWMILLDWKKRAKGRSGESTNWKQCWVLESDKTSGSHGLVGSQTKRVSDPCWSGRSPADHSIPIHKKRNKAEEPPPGYDLKMRCCCRCCPARIILLLNWRSQFNFQKFLSFFWGGGKKRSLSFHTCSFCLTQRAREEWVNLT